MIYKILLVGDNNTIINDFFVQMDPRAEFLTSSLRRDDILTHLGYFHADVFCYCAYDETRESTAKIANLKQRLDEEDILLVVTGSEEDCSTFLKTTFEVVDLVVPKPSRSTDIIDRIEAHMESTGKAARKQMELNSSQLLASLQQPVSAPTAAPATAPTSAVPTPAQIPAPSSSGKKHILVVDDNATMLKVIKEHLNKDYDVATAIGAKIALRFLERKHTDLILLDYEMPEINGPAFLEQLRSNPVTKNIPVIFVTGTTERKKIEHALIMKPQGYLLKPIDHKKLIAAITKVLGPLDTP